MLFDAQLMKELWEQAVATANYIFNRLPCRINEDRTAIELRTGQKPNFSANEGVWMCRDGAYAKIRREIGAVYFRWIRFVGDGVPDDVVRRKLSSASM